jgi:hypothetical protein
MSQLLTASELRQLFDQRKKNIEFVDVELPGLPILNGQLAIQELSPAQAEHADKLAEKDGKASQAREMAALVCKALVSRAEPHARIFSDKEVQHVSGYGMTVLLPLVLQIRKHSKLDQDAIEEVKKSLTPKPEQESDSATSSQESSEEEEPEEN